jgi:copper(I)-binding protein
VRTPLNDQASLYFTVSNDGDQPDRVLAVSTDISGSAMLHQDVVQGATSNMQQVSSLDVPAHGRLVLKAGAYHVMLMDIKQPVQAGATVQARITFEKAGTVPLAVPVVPYGQ